jgi:lipopolysaccharide export system protein LptC
MTAHDNLHSRLVAWLKVILPVAALALLSTLFLVSRTIDPSDAIPYAEVDIEERIREPRMTAPTYAGVTTDGASVTVAADEARPAPEGSDTASATRLRAQIATPDGGQADLLADSGSLDAREGVLTLMGAVEITTSTGYRITTDQVTSALERTDVQTAGAISASTPMGDLTAGRMTLGEDAAASGSYLLLFQDRVKLIYRPAN